MKRFTRQFALCLDNEGNEAVRIISSHGVSSLSLIVLRAFAESSSPFKPENPTDFANSPAGPSRESSPSAARFAGDISQSLPARVSPIDSSSLMARISFP